ncbi:MAG: crossover junction endodeoxyribonuclease RuvC [Gammaproteobacteria bacterium]
MVDSMNTILGIDPGSRITGYGIIRTDGLRHTYVTSGCIVTRGENSAQRLGQIHQGIVELLRAHTPNEVAVEQVFMHRNALSALKLGQARGAAIAAVATYNLSIEEYAPRRIKQTIAGYGAADKTQVAYMVKQVLQLTGKLATDAADALAVAICHAQSRVKP